MVDDKLEREEAQRAANYEAIKSDVKQEVGGEIVEEAEEASPQEAEKVKNIAGHMREKAVGEVVQTEREVDRGRMAARISQIVDYVFFLIYSLLAVRLLLELFAARESAGFVKFVKSATGFFYQPFAGIVPSPSVEGGFTLALPIVVAMVAYAILHLAINGLLRIVAHRKTIV